MLEPIPFQPDRFRSAAAHYLQGRPGYAAALIHDVATLCGLDGTGTLLDLGCGPGQLAAAFRPYVAAALGLDPEPEMLAVATGKAAELGLDIRFQPGSSQDLAPGLGPFRLVTIGRAFHWMDRPETARRLDGLVEAGGAVVLLHVDHPAVPDNAWRADYEAALAQATGNAERQAWRQPGWVRNEGILLDSAFCDLHRVGVLERRRTPGATLVDRALSMSSSTQARLGDKVAALRRDIEAMVARVAQDGVVTEVVESVALIARRPAV
jgi:SAM-dependent methyltransferase